MITSVSMFLMYPKRLISPTASPLSVCVFLSDSYCTTCLVDTMLTAADMRQDRPQYRLTGLSHFSVATRTVSRQTDGRCADPYSSSAFFCLVTSYLLFPAIFLSYSNMLFISTAMYFCCLWRSTDMAEAAVHLT